ncbi:crotonase/enoyl-CoA hydratase family protein [Jannaschia sp. LMIT008]|uniref:crotonase/enoyl-CoA hydratase family protein n=1 Tax=Jannaschia maritima TaxID=3032585 RepID=UPI002811E29B|nr:crotonase/enoyl-CoA hydratase family protein [Jannaschia sp. LMIT008]
MTVRVERDGRGVATVWLDRPDMRNALTAAMMDDLSAFAADPQARVAVLRGSGPMFCAGGDLRWMLDQMDADPATRTREAWRLADMLRALNEMPVPLIGAVQGGAFGGGVGLACLCDVVVATEDARFGLTETRLGLIPATIAPYVVARMGEGAARRVLMSSRRFDAGEARTLGLVARVVPAAELDAAVEAEIAPYLDCAPGAVAAAKALVRRSGPRIDRATVEAGVAALTERWADPEAREGISAFLEKRRPDWSPE